MKSVLQTNVAQFDPVATANAVASVRQIPLVDAAQLVRSHWGILAEHLEPGKAEQWGKDFAQKGLPSRVMEDSEIITPPSPVPVGKLTWSAEGLNMTLKTGGSARLAAPELTLLASCAHNEEFTKTTVHQEGPSAAQRLASAGILMATGLPIHIGPKSQKVEKKEHRSELELHLDLLGRTSAGPVRYRINGLQFDYSCLGANKQYSGLGNFKQLIKELAEVYVKAGHNRGTQIFLANRPLTDMGYRSLADLDSELRWLLTLPRL